MLVVSISTEDPCFFFRRKEDSSRTVPRIGESLWFKSPNEGWFVFSVVDVERWFFDAEELVNVIVECDIDDKSVLSCGFVYTDALPPNFSST